MGKASSSKKVARAAGTGGGRTNRGRTPWMYYTAIAVVAVLGIAGVYSSRQHRLDTISSNGKVPPKAGQDHWHVAYGIYVCDNSTKGHFLPAITDQNDPVGIHTHGDGVIHVHPFTDSSAGRNATLGKFASSTHMTLNAGELKAPGGHDYRDGDSCGGKPGRVQVYVWGTPSTDVSQVNQLVKQPGVLSTVNPPDVRLFNNNLITMAFMPKNATIPPPPAQSIFSLQHLNDVTQTPSSTTTAPGSTATTAPGTSTTAPASGSTSTTTKK